MKNKTYHFKTETGIITFPLMLACIGLLLTFYLNELKKHEKEKQRLIQNLEQANYELRTFNYIASHDIKEPIRNIGNYAGLIFRKLPNNLRIDLGDYFKTIKNSTTQLYESTLKSPIDKKFIDKTKLNLV